MVAPGRCHPPARRALLAALLCAVPAAADRPASAELEEALLAEPLEAGLDAEGAQARVQQLREGLDLATATRAQLQALPGLDAEAVLAFRAAHGGLAPPGELLDAGVLDAEQLQALGPLLSVPAPEGSLSGRVHLATAASTGDAVPPPALLEATLRGPFGLSAGLELALTRFRPGPAAWDPGLQALLTPGFGAGLELSRAFLAWRRGRLQLVAGTFEVGFAERLVLDTTRTERPDGFTLASTFRRPLATTLGCHLAGPGRTRDPACAADRLETPDFLTRDPFRGLAASVQDLPLGAGVEASGALFASWQTPRVAQDELQDPRACRPGLDGRCPSVRVFTAGGATPVVSASLPGALEEQLLGAHAQLRLPSSLTLGATAWGALLTLPGPLGFQPWSRWPAPGLVGAAGLHAAWTPGALALFAEAAYAAAARAGSGDWGVVQRSVLALPAHQLELSLRWYGPRFATLHGRPVAAADLDEGQRARNELGARLGWQWKAASSWAAWARVDAWTNPAPVAGQRPAWAPGLELLGRLDFHGPGWVQATAFTEARHSPVSPTACATSLDSWGLPAEGCAALRFKAGARVTLAPALWAPRVVLHAWLARVDPGSGWRTDGQAEAEARWTPGPGLELRGAVRALVRGLGDARPEEARLLGRLGVAWAPWPGTLLDARYEAWATLTRPAPEPNPEHRFGLDLTAAW